MGVAVEDGKVGSGGWGSGLDRRELGGGGWVM